MSRWISVLMCASFVWAATPVIAQDDTTAEQPDAQSEPAPQEQPERDLGVLATNAVDAIATERPPHEAERPWEVAPRDLELYSQTLPLEGDGETLQSTLGAWMDLLKAKVQMRNSTRIAIARENRLLTDGDNDTNPDTELIKTLERRAASEQERLLAIVERVEVIREIMRGRGAETVEEGNYIKAVRTVQPQASEEDTEAAEAEQAAQDAETPEEQEEAARLARIAEATEAIRKEPPIHERDEPWSVPVSELELEMQRLRVEQIQERADKWIEILQRKVLERNRFRIAREREENADIVTELTERETAVNDTINDIVARIEVVLDLLDQRGGDSAAYRKYITNVTGIKLNLTNINVLAAQIWAWAKSDTGGIALGMNILGFIGTLIAFWIASKIIGRLVGAAVKRVGKGGSMLLRDVMVSMIKRIVMIVGFVVALSVLGVNITPLVAAIGAAGLVIGLALQGTLSNFASGILILINRPFDVGDAVTAGGVTGKVEKLSLVNTRILTFDNQVMYVPNNEIWGGVITNLTGRDTRRVDLVIGIGYTDDIAKAESIINEIVSAHPKTLEDPAPTIKVNELGDNSVNFVVRPWSKTADYWDVYWDLTRQIKERFDADGIGIPYPQRDLHIPGQIEVVMGERKRIEAAPPAPVSAPGAGSSGPSEPGHDDDD